MTSSQEPNPFLPFLRTRRYTPPSRYQVSASHLAPLGLVSLPSWFETLSKPQKMGNPAQIAYGGYALSISVFAAVLQLENSGDSSDQGFVVYSAQGNYIRPAFIDRNFIIRVAPLRSTRTFRTMEVRVYQTSAQKEDELDLCLTTLVDLMAASPSSVEDRASLLQFETKPTPPTLSASRPPSVAHHSGLPPSAEVRSRWPEKIRKPFETLFAPMITLIETKTSPNEGIWGENALGALKGVKTSQDGLATVDKRGYDWFRSRGVYNTAQANGEHLPFSLYAANVAHIAWIMDGSLSFTPLTFTGHFFDAVKACASLDFSIRFHQEHDLGFVTSHGTDENPWFLREIQTHHSGFERTYTEGRLWRDLAPSSTSGETDFNDLKCVATMTQASVLKSWPQNKETSKL